MRDAMDEGGARLADSTPVIKRLERLAAGQAIVFGGDKVAYVSPELARAFQSGDRLVVDPETGALLHVPAAEQTIVAEAVGRARRAFGRMGEVSDAAVTAFFDMFAANLADDAKWAEVAKANAADVASAQTRGRSTTRLQATETMRQAMIAGLRTWRDMPAHRGRALEVVDHGGWRVEQLAAPLGVVGFVFEGRPNVFADAAGVIRGGNTVVFRIGSDALGAARAMMRSALEPALRAAGLPEGAAVLVDSPAHAAGWALFSDPRLSLAVARGSGRAVAQLGAVARAAGIPVSLHGTGGAWLVADASADPDRFYAAVYHSLDRKVCNTLNVCCVVASRADDLIPVFLAALHKAGERRRGCKLHVAAADLHRIPEAWRKAKAQVVRPAGLNEEPLVEAIPDSELSREWEWEETPEVSLKVVADLDEAISLFNALSPRFAASLIAEDSQAQDRFYQMIDAPFVSDGFTRWVDGQYAFNRPELGLSNWQQGRLFARGGVLSGDGVFTIRARAKQADPDLDRADAPTPPRNT